MYLHVYCCDVRYITRLMFTDVNLIFSFSNGALFKCSRKDTKNNYLATTKPHSTATDRELSILRSIQHNHLLRLYDLYEQVSHYTLVFHPASSENILQRLSHKATYTEGWHLFYPNFTPT